jgi:hypothetical protein
MILEGGGGGQQTESYELMLYVAARHTATDCWEKRRRKGYLFMIGDEMAYPALKRQEIQRLIGPNAPQEDIPLEHLIAEVRQRYHLFYVIPGGASNGANRQITNFWEDLLGKDHVLRLQDPSDTSESIAQTIGLTEGVLDRPNLLSRTVTNVTRALHAVLPPPAPTASTPASRSRRL